MASLMSAAMTCLLPSSLAQAIAIVGGTIIDTRDLGHSTHDLKNSVVLIEDGRIKAVGPSSYIRIPVNAKRIDAKGRYLIPGLIDGFGAIRTQEFARAYLYNGVTSVFVTESVAGSNADGEEKIVHELPAGPHILRGAIISGYVRGSSPTQPKTLLEHRINDRRISKEELIAEVDRFADTGYRGLTIDDDVWPDQLDEIESEVRRRGIPTFIEPAFTSYAEAIRRGVSTLLRNDRYLLQLAPAEALKARADDLRNGAAANRAVCTANPDSPAVATYGHQLALSTTALMPTLAMEASADGLDVPNPWQAPSAKGLNPMDLDVPPDPKTGLPSYLSSLPIERRKAVKDCAWHREALDAQLYHDGARFLAGSSAPGYGVMPGSGLILEINLLHRIGLTQREALAAATSNFAELYGWKDVGRIDAGYNADILVLDADPTKSLGALNEIRLLLVDGKPVNRHALLNPRH